MTIKKHDVKSGHSKLFSLRTGRPKASLLLLVFINFFFLCAKAQATEPACGCSFQAALGEELLALDPQALSETFGCKNNAAFRQLTNKFGCSYANYNGQWYLSLTDERLTPYLVDKLRQRGININRPNFNHPLSSHVMHNGNPLYTCAEPQILLDAYNGKGNPLHVDWRGRIRYPTIRWIGKREHPGIGINKDLNGALRTCEMPACETCRSTLTRVKDARRFLNNAGLDGDRLPIKGPGRFVPGAAGVGAGLVTGILVDWGTTEGLVELGLDREEAQHWGGGAGFGAGWMAGEGVVAHMGGTKFFSLSGGASVCSTVAAAGAVHTHIMLKEICPNTERACEGMQQSAAQPITNTYLDQMDLDKNREEVETLLELNSCLGLGSIWFGVKYWTGFGPAGGIGGGW